MEQSATRIRAGPDYRRGPRLMETEVNPNTPGPWLTAPLPPAPAAPSQKEHGPPSSLPCRVLPRSDLALGPVPEAAQRLETHPFSWDCKDTLSACLEGTWVLLGLLMTQTSL